MKRFCLSLELRDDPALIAEYVAMHQAVWPEIEASIRKAGILDMQIYRLGTRLAMLIEAEDDFSFERKAELDRANPKVLEWEERMGAFQRVEAGADPVSRWQAMELIYQLDR